MQISINAVVIFSLISAIMAWSENKKNTNTTVNAKLKFSLQTKVLNSGLAVSIWTGAWHIARHINLRRAIKKRRKFHSETKIQSLAILSCTTEYRVLFAFVPFSVAIWVVYEEGLKKQTRDFILLRQTRRALKGAPRQVKARAEARARDRVPQTARPVKIPQNIIYFVLYFQWTYYFFTEYDF